ncbi:hypothetical protein [Mammaliicoccus sciuri]|uniref:hypothetical protein n=1 Tax=Mammaliicoccus sciuri TaxID=1296 RepID=UPI002DB5AC78|nr:hypothetical protein [Mammaliicoccus sciuri]MEB7783063.1 hypothetical protein [Mammaliicoccus sciuri]
MKGLNSMLTIITIILSSTVISAIVTGIVSSRMKRKELEVQINLDEKNKWILNLDKNLIEHIDNVNKYLLELIKYSNIKIEKMNLNDYQNRTDNLSNRLLSVKKTHNNLIFYIYQVEYAHNQKEKVEKIIGKITNISNKQMEDVLTYIKSKDKTMTISDLKEKLVKTEKYLADNTYELSKEIGELIRLEKIEMTNKILKSKSKKMFSLKIK